MFEDDDDNDLAKMIDNAPSGLRSGPPNLQIIQEGGNIIIQNFQQIVRDMQRDENHLKKYISSALGVKTKIKGEQLVIYAQILKSQVKEIFDDYYQKYIVCPSCGKPDTLFKKEGEHKIIIHCLACGAENVVS